MASIRYIYRVIRDLWNCRANTACCAFLWTCFVDDSWGILMFKLMVLWLIFCTCMLLWAWFFLFRNNNFFHLFHLSLQFLIFFLTLRSVHLLKTKSKCFVFFCILILCSLSIRLTNFVVVVIFASLSYVLIEPLYKSYSGFVDIFSG